MSMSDKNGGQQTINSELVAGTWAPDDIPRLKMALAMTGFPCALRAIRTLEAASLARSAEAAA